MKTTFLSLLLLVFLSFGCQKDTTDHIAVIYVENICCENLERVISTQSRPRIEYLYASNLERYDIPKDYQFGDTLLIKYEPIADADLTEDFDDCVNICNRLGGELVKILDIAEF